MQIDELPAVDLDVDHTKILPIQQKRIIAFINHFIMNTVSYLNTFAQSCESRFLEFEYKMQKVEASLLILESQLSSIPGLDSLEDTLLTSKTRSQSTESNTLNSEEIQNKSVEEQNSTQLTDVSAEVEGVIKTCEDPRYKKFFKMLQFGVPEPAVKLKMQAEGWDPSILDTPNKIIPVADDYTNNLQSNNSSDSE